ncbi:MAG: MFS transporter [Ilumatobacter sp.]|nr:MFS transporter [Ilumatobacter sp.]
MSVPPGTDAYVAPDDRLITRPFVVVTVSAALFFMYIGTLVPLVPLFIEGPLDGGEFGLGLNAAIFATAAIFARPALGRLADRYGRRSVIVAGASLAAAGGMAMSQVDALAPLLALRALTGIGEAAVFVGAATLIADLSPRDRRAEGASYFSVAVFTGLGVGPVFSEWLLDDVRFERTFIAAGAFAIGAAAVAVFAPSRVISPDDSEPSTVDAGGHASPPVKELASSGIFKFIHPAAIGPGAVLAMGVGGLTTFFLFAPEYARDVGLSNSGTLFLLYALVSLVIRLFGAKLPERLGARRSVTIALVSMAAGLTVFAAVHEVWALWVGAALIGLGAAFNYPSLMALTVNNAGDSERASAISSFTMFFEIGSAGSGLLVGAFAQAVGKQVGFLGGVAFCLVGLFVLRTIVAPADDLAGDDAVPSSSPSMS